MDLKMRLDLIRFYYMSNNSPIGALRKYKKENKLKKNLCNLSSIVKLKQKFKKHILCMIYWSVGRKSLLCEQIPAAKEVIGATSNENQSASIRKVSRSTGVPSANVHRIMRKCIGLDPYKLQML